MRHRVLVDAPLDLRRTLAEAMRWGGTPWMKLEPGGGWVAERTPAGPGTVHLTQRGDEVEVEAWGPGAAAMIERVPLFVGEGDDPGRLDASLHPLVHELARASRGVRLGRAGTLFPRLVSAILGQRVTGAQGKEQLQTLAWRWGERAPGPREDLWLVPTAERLAAAPYYVLHPFGIERNRAGTLIRAAREAAWLERSLAMAPELAHRRLQHIPGIGPWTSGVVVALTLGDPDSLPIGDFHLPNVVAWNLAGEPRADDRRMLELLAPWAGQRGRVARLLKGGGRTPPRYGPKVETFDITDA